jgi:hypothetical protein
VIERAQAAGALRADFTRQDIGILMKANAGVVQRAADPNAWRRQLELLLRGLAAR